MFPTSGFLQIPPHDGHPCLRLYPSHYRADSGLAPVRNVRRRAHQHTDRPVEVCSTGLIILHIHNYLFFPIIFSHIKSIIRMLGLPNLSFLHRIVLCLCMPKFIIFTALVSDKTRMRPLLNDISPIEYKNFITEFTGG